MGINGELFVMVLLVMLIIYGLYRRFNTWLDEPEKPAVPVDYDSYEPDGEAASLLTDTGYEIIHGKKRIPIEIQMDAQQLESRLFIDYFVRKDDELFAVKVARSRMPVELTGSGLRDSLLIYQLLYGDMSGVIYIDTDAGTLRVVKFTVDLE
ncbi:hypothetical protein [Paenibacillus gansuensis]|uniref:DUF4860 domain-containing protein n=1 Tax=Paenibacillus gansuensis TaxID=306542 RepID=A0ABW5PA67_9BACL